jgi:hypothetical protein
MVDWEEVFKTLGSTTVIIAAFAFVAQSVIKQLLKRDIEGHKDDLKRETQVALLARKNEFEQQMETFRKEVAAGAAREDRIREEITRWANPILGSVKELEGRLYNILSDDGYLALSPVWDQDTNSEWSVTYEYFLPSTVYLFCQYFCWIRLFEEKISFELFRKHQEKDSLRDKLRDVERTLGSFPLEELESLSGKGDRQVFRLQQRAMGEALASAEGLEPRCMRFSDFSEKWDEASFRQRFDPLTRFLDRLRKEDKHRWRRLELMKEALEKLRLECEGVLTRR